MKKLTLLFLMLIACTMLFAQSGNNGTINQKSSENSAKITQVGSVNEALIVQSGAGDHEALVDQQSSGNLVTKINQGGTENYTTVTQKDNSPRSMGKNWVNEINQLSDDNKITIDQAGTYNYIGKLTQAGGNDNEIEIDQIGLNNRVEKRDGREVLQQGKRDEFKVWQNGWNNLVRLVDQVQADQGKFGGGFNDFIVVQGDRDRQSYGSYVEGDQKGYDNNTYVEQFGSLQATSFYQYGQKNDLKVHQDGIYGKNTALYNMTGIDKDGTSWEEASVQNAVSYVDAEIFQTKGSSNTAMMTVRKDNNELNIYQTGKGNIGNIDIDGSGNGRNSQYFVGYGRYGHWMQTERTVNITQFGSDNVGNINITGNDNSAVIIQGTGSAIGPQL